MAALHSQAVVGSATTLPCMGATLPVSKQHAHQCIFARLVHMLSVRYMQRKSRFSHMMLHEAVLTTAAAHKGVVSMCGPALGGLPFRAALHGAGQPDGHQLRSAHQAEVDGWR